MRMANPSGFALLQKKAPLVGAFFMGVMPWHSRGVNGVGVLTRAFGRLFLFLPAQRGLHRRRTKAAPEEQLKALKKRIRILSALLSVCVVLLIVLSVVTLRYMSANRLLPGQNYSAVTTTAATEGS